MFSRLFGNRPTKPAPALVQEFEEPVLGVPVADPAQEIGSNPGSNASGNGSFKSGNSGDLLYDEPNQLVVSDGSVKRLGKSKALDFTDWQCVQEELNSNPEPKTIVFEVQVKSKRVHYKIGRDARESLVNRQIRIQELERLWAAQKTAAVGLMPVRQSAVEDSRDLGHLDGEDAAQNFAAQVAPRIDDDNMRQRLGVLRANRSGQAAPTAQPPMVRQKRNRHDQAEEEEVEEEEQQEEDQQEEEE